MGLFDFLRPRCPACGNRGLVIAGGIRATVVVDGKRAPASWTYYRCPTCAGRFRQDLGGPMNVANEDEWRRDVGAA